MGPLATWRPIALPHESRHDTIKPLFQCDAFGTALCKDPRATFARFGDQLAAEAHPSKGLGAQI